MGTLRSFLMTAIRERIVSRALPFSVTDPLNRNDREGALYRAWGHVFANHIVGGYYEFGVFRGERFRSSYQIREAYGQHVRGELHAVEAWRRTRWLEYRQFQHGFYGFDSFEGLPENSEGNPAFPEGGFTCSLEQFAMLNRKAGIAEGSHVRYFKGTFAEIAKHQAREIEKLQPAAIVNIDCDLYLSARDALALIAPKFIQGTVLLMDDWNYFSASNEKGERRALREFLQRHPELSIESWFAYGHTCHAFIVHRATS